ncbi:MAG: hypothetical protein M5U08_14095 [Burkholderiales bacterium]|nr:hypothetical protein [Burkholderiales bacterium]
MKLLLDGTFVEKDSDLIRWMPVAIVGLFFLHRPGAFAPTYFGAWVAKRVVTDLREQMFATLLRLSSVLRCDLTPAASNEVHPRSGNDRCGDHGGERAGSRTRSPRSASLPGCCTDWKPAARSSWSAGDRHRSCQLRAPAAGGEPLEPGAVGEPPPTSSRRRLGGQRA